MHFKRVIEHTAPVKRRRLHVVIPSFYQMPPRIMIEGVGVHNFRSHAAFFEALRNMAKQKDRGIPAMALTLNVHAANLAHANPAYKAIYQQAEILAGDGVGLKLAGRLLGTPLHARMVYADCFYEMLRYFAANHLTVYLLGAEPGVLETVMAKVDKAVKNHSIVGFHHGHLKNDPALNAHVQTEINRLQPDVVLVGMGMPIQEHWINENREHLHCGVLFAVGGLFDYFAGKQHRISWLGKLGLEWAFRLLTQPRRLFKRYVVGTPHFLVRILRDTMQSRFSR